MMAKRGALGAHLLRAGGVFGLIALGLFAFGALNIAWGDWARPNCWPGCFCEAFQPGRVSQPLSVYSNLFYVLVGALILGKISRPKEQPANRMLRQPGYQTGYGLAVIAIGVTSWFYHVSLTQVGRWFDYMGMYAFAGYAMLYNLVRLKGWNARTFLGAYMLLLAVLGGLWIAAPESKRYLFAGLVLAVLLLEALLHWRKRPQRIQAGYLYASLACFLAGYAANMLDEAGLICAPHSPWQWHLFWHFATALAAGLLYLYYLSEEERAG